MADGDGTTTTTTKPDDAAARAAASAATPEDDDDLGEKGIKALEAWKKRAKEAEGKVKEYEPLAARAKEADEAAKTETQKAAERAQAAEAKAQQESARALRYEVAAEVGLPLKMAARLQGASREDLLEDATELLETLGGGKDAGAARRTSNGNAGTEGTPPGGGMNDALRAGLRTGRMTITT